MVNMKKGKANNRQHRALKCNPNVKHKFKHYVPKSALLNRTILARDGISAPIKVRRHKKRTGKPKFKGDNLIICNECHMAGKLAGYFGRWPICENCASRVKGMHIKLKELN